MKTYLLIDGYNLMYAAGLGRQQYGPQQLERQRNRFLGFLTGHLYPRERRLTCVVFDAFDAPDHLPQCSTVGEMEVQFADPGCDADSLIEELIARHSAPKQVCVISSDHRLQQAILRRRGVPCDSESFYRQLRNRGEVGRDGTAGEAVSEPAGKFGADMSLTALETWLEEFGELSLEQIQQELLRNAQSRQFPPLTLPKPAPETTPEQRPRKQSSPTAKRNSRRSRKNRTGDSADRERGLSAGEVEHWMKEFGFFSGPGGLNQFDKPDGSGET